MQPSSSWQFATAASAPAPSFSCFLGKPSVIPQHPRRRISLLGLHEDGTAHCCPTHSKGILLPPLGWLLGSFSILLSHCRNWIYGIKTIGRFGTKIQRFLVCASDNPWIKNGVWLSCVHSLFANIVFLPVSLATGYICLFCKEYHKEKWFLGGKIPGLVLPTKILGGRITLEIPPVYSLIAPSSEMLIMQQWPERVDNEVMCIYGLCVQMILSAWLFENK